MKKIALFVLTILSSLDCGTWRILADRWWKHIYRQTYSDAWKHFCCGQWGILCSSIQYHI